MIPHGKHPGCHPHHLGRLLDFENSIQGTYVNSWVSNSKESAGRLLKTGNISGYIILDGKRRGLIRGLLLWKCPHHLGFTLVRFD